jgi:alcohol dehydrogenase (cytochrome c)
MLSLARLILPLLVAFYLCISFTASGQQSPPARTVPTLEVSSTAQVPSGAEVSFDRLKAAASEPGNWLTYGGSYASNRFSTLKQIAPANVKNLELQWILQDQIPGYWESNPLVVDGIMYVTQRPNDVLALDAKTGKVFWIYHYTNAPNARVCCGANNRGLAMLGTSLFMGTLDGHVVAIDSRSGQPLWNTNVGDLRRSVGMSGAPLVVKDKVIVGVSGGDSGIRGFVAALDAETGKEIWRFYTIPGPGESGHETWQNNDDWEHGGGATWVTGSYDPQLNLIYWGVGNPGPDYNPKQRPGDNLYSNSVIALDADTGKLVWHFQFTPNDGYDYDSTEVPVLADMRWKGVPSKLMLWANRNGFFYVLDRVTGKFLLGKNFIPVNWASGLDSSGRPIQTPPTDGTRVYPGVNGGTNWYPPSYNPLVGLFYVPIWENYAAIFHREDQEYKPGTGFSGGGFIVAGPTPAAPTPHMGKTGPHIDNATDETGNGAVIAIDPNTGNRVWTHKMFDVTDAGILSTAGGLLFSGGREGFFYALDAKTGRNLWDINLGAMIAMAPITYAIGGRQYVSVISGHTMATFALRDGKDQ